MAARVTITLPEDVLDRLDTIAHEEGVTRSDVVREAAAHYLTERTDRQEATARKLAVEDGIAWLESIAAAPQEESQDSLTVLRELRGAESVGSPIEPEQHPSAKHR